MLEFYHKLKELSYIISISIGIYLFKTNNINTPLLLYASIEFGSNDIALSNIYIALLYSESQWWERPLFMYAFMHCESSLMA